MKLILILLLFPLVLTSSAHALDVPKPQGYVNDYGNMISPGVRAELERELAAFEASDSNQVVILTIPSLEGEDIESFSIKVAESWKPGQKGKDNGVILLVSKEDKKIRIEVGRGLEGTLTDLMSGRIIDLVIKPRFKRGDFDGGFVAGVSAIVDATRGEFRADGPPRAARHSKKASGIFTLLIFGAVVVLILGSMSRVLGGVAGAVALPSIVAISIASMGLVWIVILALAGLGLGLVLPVLFSSGGSHRGGGIGHWGGFSGGGFSGGGFGGGGFGGGGFGGGGFGGGGGGFGGGGASGDW